MNNTNNLSELANKTFTDSTSEGTITKSFSDITNSDDAFTNSVDAITNVDKFREYCLNNINKPKKIFDTTLYFIRNYANITSSNENVDFNSNFINKILPANQYVDVYKSLLTYIFTTYFNGVKIDCGPNFYDTYVAQYGNRNVPSYNKFKKHFERYYNFFPEDDDKVCAILLTRAIIILFFKYRKIDEKVFYQFADFFRDKILENVEEGNWKKIGNCLLLPEQTDYAIKEWRSNRKYGSQSVKGSVSKIGKLLGFGGKKTKKGNKSRKNKKTKKNKKSRKN